jgi:hypothetical protein
MKSSGQNSERRQFGRRKIYMHGWVKVPGRPTLPCVIHDLSDGGALLVFDEPFKLPFAFLLKIDTLPDVKGCEIRHSSGRRVGVEFIDVELVRLNSRLSVNDEVGSWIGSGAGPR